MQIIDLSGRTGVDIFVDTDPHTGSWPAFQTVQDTVIAAITITPVHGFKPSVIPTGETISCGILVPAGGRITSIELTSGGVEMIREF